MRVVLLGPQRRPTVDAAIRALGLAGTGFDGAGFDGPVATITAGWREREPDDGELSGLLGGRDTNLGLYRRWLDAQERDPGYAAAERRVQGPKRSLYSIGTPFLTMSGASLSFCSAFSGRSSRSLCLDSHALSGPGSLVRLFLSLKKYSLGDVTRFPIVSQPLLE